MKTQLFLLCFLSSQLMAQTYLSLYVAVNPRTDIFNNTNVLNQYWRNDVSIGVAYETSISTNISIAPSIETAYYKWDHFIDSRVFVPEISLISASGDDSRVWRFFLDGKLIPKNKIVPTYISTGIGYIYEDIGSVRATYNDMNGPEFTRTQPRYAHYYFVHTLGIGLRWIFVSDFGIDIRALYYTNYSNRFQVSMVFGISYLL